MDEQPQSAFRYRAGLAVRRWWTGLVAALLLLLAGWALYLHAAANADLDRGFSHFERRVAVHIAEEELEVLHAELDPRGQSPIDAELDRAIAEARRELADARAELEAPPRLRWGGIWLASGLLLLVLLVPLSALARFRPTLTVSVDAVAIRIGGWRSPVHELVGVWRDGERLHVRTLAGDQRSFGPFVDRARLREVVSELRRVVLTADERAAERLARSSIEERHQHVAGWRERARR